jgi:DNA modification methylase
LLSKNNRYFYDSDAVKEDTANIIDKRPGGFERDRMYDYDSKIKLMGRRPGGRFGGEKYGDNDDKQFGKYSGKEYAFTGKRNKRSVWSVPTKSFRGAHFATFPVDLITPCVLAGCPEKICVECDTPYTKEPIHGTITKSADDWEQNLYLLD